MLERMLTAEGAAALLVAVAGLAAVAWAVWDSLDALAPNVVTEGLAIAFGIFVLDRLARRREEARVRPRVDRALSHIGPEFSRFSWAVAMDYA